MARTARYIRTSKDHWTSEEVAFLKENYAKMSPTLISRKLNRAYNGVVGKAYSLKLVKLRVQKTI